MKIVTLLLLLLCLYVTIGCEILPTPIERLESMSKPATVIAVDNSWGDIVIKDANGKFIELHSRVLSSSLEKGEIIK